MIFHPNQQVEVIRHQAKGVGIHHPIQIFCVLLQKEPIILVLPENILHAIGMIVDMVGLAWFHLFCFLGSD